MVMLIPQTEESRIADAIREAESKTTGEIVVAEVTASSDYGAAALLWGLAGLFAMSLGLVVAYDFGWIRTWAIETLELVIFVLLQAVGLAIGILLSRIPALRRWAVSPKTMDAAAREGAARAFAAHGLARTPDRNGVLIYLSRFEREVVILADEGIDRKVPPASWEALDRQLIEGIRKREAVPALLKVIEQIGRHLEQTFPKTAGDSDSISNEIRRG